MYQSAPVMRRAQRPLPPPPRPEGMVPTRSAPHRPEPYGSVFKARYSSRERPVEPGYPSSRLPNLFKDHYAHDAYGDTYDSSRPLGQHTRTYRVPTRPSRRYSQPDSDDGLSELEEDSDVDIFDGDTESRTYNFQLARPRPPPSSIGSTEDDHSSTLAEVELTTPALVRQKTVSHVYESRYTGLGIPDDFHGARLTVVDGAAPAASAATTARPLFRWIHFPWKSMSFDDFADEVTRTSGFTAAERQSVADLMNEVRRKHVKSIQVANSRSVRHMDPACIRRELPSDGTPKGKAATTPRTATWMCLPYFSLESYSSLDTASGFPVQTLLQSQFPRVAKARDMQQAVCRSKQVPAGYCFHIAQLWCLVIDNSLLFTCSRMPERSLGGESIERIRLSPEDVSGGGKLKAKISVCYRGSVMWTIPLEDCQTWLDFISHFRETWQRRLLFFRQKHQVTAGDWPKVWQAASRSNITLDLKIGTGPPLPPSGVLIRPRGEDTPDSVGPPQPQKEGSPSPEAHLKPVRDPKARNSRSPSPAPPSPRFSLLTYLDGVSTATRSPDLSVLKNHLASVEEYLLRDTGVSDRKRFKECPIRNRMDLHKSLEGRGLDVPAYEKSNYETQIDVFNAADVIFNFFLPASTDIPTAGKFWGAVNLICDMPGRNDDDDYSDTGLSRKSFEVSSFTARVTLRDIVTKLNPFTDIFNHASKSDRSTITVPDELLQAWIHILMGLIYFPIDSTRAFTLLDGEATRLIDEGLRDIAMSMSDRTLLGQAALLPLDLVSLIALDLVKNPTPGMPDVATTYLNQLLTMDSDIDTKPSDRSHERHLQLFTQEVTLIRRTVASQRDVLSSLSRHNQGAWHDRSPREGNNRHRPALLRVPRSAALLDNNFDSVSNAPGGNYTKPRSMSPSLQRAEARGTGPPGKLRLMSVEAGGFRDLLQNACLIHLEWADMRFSQLLDQAGELVEVTLNKVHTTKDRQERAIYAFTIVTVVFLPLSAVSSIFGMNTVDIRDMEVGQWAYWAAAIPVTMAVVFLGLFFTGELQNMWAWGIAMRPRTERYGWGEREDPDTGYVSKLRVRGEGNTPRVRWS